MKRRELKIKNRASEWSMNIRSSPASLLRSKSSLSEGGKEDKVLFDHQKLVSLFLIIFSGGLIFFPLFSLAAELVPCGGPGEPACQFCHFFVMFDGIIDFIFLQLVPPIAVLMLAIGGAMFFFSAGDPGKVNTGKSIITSVIIGLIIIYGAWLIINLFFSIIGVASRTGLKEGWFKINCPISP